MSIRIFTENKLQAEQTIELDKNASTHLLRVLRLVAGDSVELFNGDGNNYNATISAVGKRAKLDIHTQQPGLRPSPLNITLVQGISRGDRMDFSVQKAVELGVQSIQPVFSEKSKVRLDGERLEKKIQHWRAVVISACEQCGRSDLPEIFPAISLAELFKTHRSELSLVLAFGDHPDLASASSLAKGKLSVLIGPESGLSEQEIIQAVNTGWTACQLGPRILRTETATIAALSVIQYAAGDLTSSPIKI